MKTEISKMKRSTKLEREQWALEAHREADRTDYDMPGSVRYCPCDSCNESRKRHGVAIKLWSSLVAREDVDFDDDFNKIVNRTLFWNGG